MPASHAEQFRAVAIRENYIILCRAPGSTCRQLLEQGFDTKGFRVHAKSCDWGPMAGYVVRDPRLNKKGLTNETFNRREHAEAMGDTNHAGWAASTTPLKLYPERVRWLQRKGIIAIYPMPRNPDVYTGTANHSTGVHFKYILAWEMFQGQRVWGVYFDTDSSPFRQEVGGTSRSYYRPGLRDLFSTRYEAMLAMTNPAGYASWPAGDFRNAITGDYDLFAVWPRANEYDPEGRDRRVLGTAHALSDSDAIDHMEHHFTEVGGHAQATKIGNITDRLYELCQLLNSAIGNATSPGSVPAGPFPKRMVCWHSDEAARPGVDDVDLPLIAFAPSGLELGLETIDDFRRLVDEAVRQGFAVNLAEGWVRNPNPAKAKPNQLGGAYLDLIPNWQRGHGNAPQPLAIPAWYNR